MTNRVVSDHLTADDIAILRDLESAAVRASNGEPPRIGQSGGSHPTLNFAARLLVYAPALLASAEALLAERLSCASAICPGCARGEPREWIQGGTPGKERGSLIHPTRAGVGDRNGMQCWAEAIWRRGEG